MPDPNNRPDSFGRSVGRSSLKRLERSDVPSSSMQAEEEPQRCGVHCGSSLLVDRSSGGILGA